TQVETEVLRAFGVRCEEDASCNAAIARPHVARAVAVAGCHVGAPKLPYVRIAAECRQDVHARELRATRCRPGHHHLAAQARLADRSLRTRGRSTHTPLRGRNGREQAEPDKRGTATK